MLKFVLLYLAGGAPVILILALFWQRIKILTLRELVRATTESNVLLAEEVKKTTARAKAVEDREANLAQRPIVLTVRPEALDKFAEILLPSVCAAVDSAIAKNTEIHKLRPN